MLGLGSLEGGRHGQENERGFFRRKLFKSEVDRDMIGHCIE